MDDLVARLFELRKRRDVIDDEIRALSREIVANAGDDDRVFTDDYFVTVSRPERRVVDLDALRIALDAPTFATVTKTVVDLAAFDAAYDRGQISDADLVDVLTFVPMTPSVRIKERTANTEEGPTHG